MRWTKLGAGPHEQAMDQPADELSGSPRHGFQGDRGAPLPVRAGPAALSVAVSREAGARGGTIARRVARKLGWQVFDQELLEYMAQVSGVNPDVVENLSASANAWAEDQLRQLMENGEIAPNPPVINLARVVLALAAQGQVVLIGRGAGNLLPHETTLHVRIVAPLPERVAYMAQWLRLTEEEAAARVRLRDDRRADFLSSHFRRQAGDVYQYDLILNSSLLGEELCAELIAQAARARARALNPAADLP